MVHANFPDTFSPMAKENCEWMMILAISYIVEQVGTICPLFSTQSDVE